MDQRTLYLGDAPPVETVETFRARVDATATDFAVGRYRGWVRDWTHAGVSFPDPGYPHAEVPPTLEEWAAYDQVAHDLGLDRNVLAAKAIAAKKARISFGEKLQNAARALGRGDLVKAVSGTINAVSGEIDNVIPGAGAFITNVVLNALTPILPFAPALSASLASVAGGLPFVGYVAGPLVQGAGQAGQSWFQGVRAGDTSLVLPKELPSSYQADLQSAVAESLVRNVSGVADTLGPLKASLDRVITLYQDTNGPLLKKLEAVGTELVAELGFAVQVACFIGSIATLEATAPACAALGAALAALKAGLTVVKAENAAKDLKTAASQARADALKEAARLDAEARALEDAIAKLRAQRASEERAAQVGRSLVGAAAFVAGVAVVAEVVA